MRQNISIQRSALAIGLVGILLVSAFSLAVAPAAAQTTDTETATQTETATECQGEPRMSQTSIALLDDTITSERSGTVEANFRPEPTLPEDCTIVVDLEFSFAQSGFQFGGGANWDQSTTNLVVTQFEVRPGEIRDIRAQLFTNGAEPGDSVTVVADYELWYKGDRENSVQQSGIRRTIDVEAANTPAQTAAGSGDDAAQQIEATPSQPSPILQMIGANLGLFMVFILGLVSTVGLIYREPIINIITGGN